MCGFSKRGHDGKGYGEASCASARTIAKWKFSCSTAGEQKLQLGLVCSESSKHPSQFCPCFWRSSQIFFFFWKHLGWGGVKESYYNARASKCPAPLREREK